MSSPTVVILTAAYNRQPAGSAEAYPNAANAGTEELAMVQEKGAFHAPYGLPNNPAAFDRT